MLEYIANIMGLSIGIYFGYIVYIILNDEFIQKDKELTKKDDGYKI